MESTSWSFLVGICLFSISSLGIYSLCRSQESPSKSSPIVNLNFPVEMDRDEYVFEGIVRGIEHHDLPESIIKTRKSRHEDLSIVHVEVGTPVWIPSAERHFAIIIDTSKPALEKRFSYPDNRNRSFAVGDSVAVIARKSKLESHRYGSILLDSRSSGFLAHRFVDFNTMEFEQGDHPAYNTRSDYERALFDWNVGGNIEHQNDPLMNPNRLWEAWIYFQYRRDLILLDSMNTLKTKNNILLKVVTYMKDGIWDFHHCDYSRLVRRYLSEENQLEDLNLLLLRNWLPSIPPTRDCNELGL